MIQNSAFLSRNLNSPNNSEQKRTKKIDGLNSQPLFPRQIFIWSLPSLEVKSLLYLFWHLVRFTLLNCSLLLFCLTRGLVLLSMEEMLFWVLTLDAKPQILLPLSSSNIRLIMDKEWLTSHVFYFRVKFLRKCLTIGNG